MKNKVIISMLALAAVISLSFAYLQKVKADNVLNEASRLRKELKQSEQQTTVARIEASKLRTIIEKQKKGLAQAMIAVKN